MAVNKYAVFGLFASLCSFAFIVVLNTNLTKIATVRGYTDDNERTTVTFYNDNVKFVYPGGKTKLVFCDAPSYDNDDDKNSDTISVDADDNNETGVGVNSNTTFAETTNIPATANNEHPSEGDDDEDEHLNEMCNKRKRLVGFLISAAVLNGILFFGALIVLIVDPTYILKVVVGLGIIATGLLASTSGIIAEQIQMVEYIEKNMPEDAARSKTYEVGVYFSSACLVLQVLGCIMAVCYWRFSKSVSSKYTIV